jgi:hypothetical protein
MALADLPGKCVWARSPEGKESTFGLYVYAPEDTGKFEYPQIGLAVIKRLPDGSWQPWMAEKSKARYNPRVFCYVDTIPQLIDALQEILAKHRPGAKKSEGAAVVMRQVLNQARAEDQLDVDVRKFHEFG